MKPVWIVILVIPIIILMVLSVFLGAVVFKQRVAIAMLKEDIARLQTEKVGVTPTLTTHPGASMSIKSNPKMVQQKISCKYCGGEGRHAIDRGDRKEPVVYGCPICRGRGFNVIKIPSGSVRCDVCGGLGSLGYEYQDHDELMKWGAKLCVNCNGAGRLKESD